MNSRTWSLSLFAICALAVVISVGFGTTQINFRDSLAGLAGQSTPDINEIIQTIRLPRVLLAACVGAGLGASGAALQGFTRNALAAPGLLGFSACAALGAVLALYFGLSKFVTPAAIFFAFVGATAITLFSRRKPGASGLVLGGIGIGALATAVTGLVMNLAPNPWALSELIYWLMGSLKNADLPDVIFAAPLTLLGLALLLYSGPALRVLGLGEETAQSLGISVSQTQLLIVAGCALCIGSGVAVAGAIGFVGLFIPHIIRFVIGPDEAWLILFSALGGAIFLILIDTLIRMTAGPGTPLYLGIVTSLIGVPFFLFLAWRQT
ncbi:ABC transporter permease [Litorimonas cladophorae]|uniref:ABC transporter permease n=1 Tax=Litorimonas cladophorae TaxID=1220491 RepID=A0A918KPZ8_9PROT|nr:iron ABC transporter permease [Litorimonas cladophorae]GGX72044.1 ABC transporter permease [Litorimonas cladophorae]